MHTQFIYMAEGRIIQADGPQVADHCVIEFIPSSSFNSNCKAGALGVYREIFLFSEYFVHQVPLFKIVNLQKFIG
jgi:hypothetical protein